jgi:hypothetical protein
MRAAPQQFSQKAPRSGIIIFDHQVDESKVPYSK